MGKKNKKKKQHNKNNCESTTEDKSILIKDSHFLLKIRVKPNCKYEKILFSEEEIEICIMTQPIEGKANKEIAKILSSVFKVAKSSISIIKGQLNRNKLIRIDFPGFDYSQIVQLLESY